MLFLHKVTKQKIEALFRNFKKYSGGYYLNDVFLLLDTHKVNFEVHVDHFKLEQKIFLEVNNLYAVFMEKVQLLTTGHLISMQSAMTYFQSESASG